MAKQLVNIGTSENKGDGDPLRAAFTKINNNFNELYDANFADPSALESSLLPGTDGSYDIGSSNKQWADVYIKDFVYLTGTRLSMSAEGDLIVNNGSLKYIPESNVHWDAPAPKTVSEALDRIASAIYALNGEVPI